MPIDGRQYLRGQVMGLQQAPEVQDGRLVRYRAAGQRQSAAKRRKGATSYNASSIAGSL